MLANHVLISIFELGSKESKMVTTKTFGGVAVVTYLFLFFGGCYHIELSLPKQSRPKHRICVSVVTKGNTQSSYLEEINTICVHYAFFILVLVVF